MIMSPTPSPSPGRGEDQEDTPTDDNPFPGILRLFFHDCFVEGCDGSILITSTTTEDGPHPHSRTHEKDAQINLSLDEDAFEAVALAKSAVEKKCPGIVSCADILAILARDAVAMLNGPKWAVEKGRRDGLISIADHATRDLPSPTTNLTQLIERFERKGVNAKDLVTLSGAHTVGLSHCTSFERRVARNDSGMDQMLREKLIRACGFPKTDPNVTVGIDDGTSLRFNSDYFNNLLKGKGLLDSDHALIQSAKMESLVSRYSEDEDLFFKEFGIAMQKLGRVGIKTAEGEIRKDCTRFNR